MRITRATPDDLDTLVAFRDQAAAWLASKGIDQWQEPWPTEDLMVEGMLRNIEAGETFIVWDDDTPRPATITINRWAKPELWTEQEQGRAGAVRPQGHRRPRLRRPGPGRRAAGLGRHPRPTKVPTGCGSTCGPPTSASSTTTCARASPTSAPSCSPTTPRGRCSSGQPSASPHPTCKRSRA